MVRACIAAIVGCLLFVGSAAAQQGAAGIQATGIGTASAPAQTAELQLLLGSSIMFGYSPVVYDVATPDAAMPTDGSFGAMALSDESLAPLVDAIVASGVERDAITVTAPVQSSMFGPGGPEVAEIRLTIDQPQADALTELVAGLPGVAAQSGLTVLYIGARYRAADCTALLQEARMAAIADANERAQGLADGLGVTLGNLEQASESPYFGPTGLESCAPAGTEGDFGMYGPGSEPAFDPSVTEATATVQVTLTYAIAEAA